MSMHQYDHYIFDWGDTLMEDLPSQHGPMYTWPDVKVVEGAADCLKHLAQVAKCHVATNALESTQLDIRKAFERVQLSDYIEEIFCFNSIGHKKPSTQYFEFIRSSLAAPKSAIVVIGDSLENDVFGALKHGFNALWFNRKRCNVPAGVKAIRKLNEIIVA